MREQLVDAVAEWLRRIEETRDPSLALEPEPLEDVKRLVGIVEDDDLEARHTLGWFHWYAYAALPEEHNDAVLELAVTELTPCFVEGVGELPEPLLPLLAEHATTTAFALLEHAAGAADPSIVAANHDLWQRILAVIPEDHPVRPLYLAGLGEALHLVFESTGRGEDLDGAVTVCRQAVRTATEESGRSACQETLAFAQLQRFEIAGVAADLDEAVATYREVIAPADTVGRETCLANLCHALRLRFEHTGALDDLDEAVAVGRAAVAAVPTGHPHLTTCLQNLGLALHVRYERTGRPDDIDGAVAASRRAVDAAAPGHPDHLRCLHGLSTVLRARSEHTGSRTELAEAIALGQEAVRDSPVDHPDRAQFLNSLGTALHLRFERTGNGADLDDAITTGRAAVRTSVEGTSLRNMCLTNLCMTLRRRFDRTRSLVDLEEAITAARSALRTAHPNDLYRTLCMSNLSAALDTRFQQTGAIANLTEAIAVSRDAVRATPANHPDRAIHLANLATALAHRYEHTGAPTDLDEAITGIRDCVRATPHGAPNRAVFLGNLSAGLDARFQLTGVLANLDEAVTTAREAAQSVPDDDPNHARHLSGLSASLYLRFERTGALADLDEAVTAARAAVREVPADDANRAVWVANLGIALIARFQLTGAEADLADAIDAQRGAVEAAPATHPYKGAYLSTLSIALRLQFDRTRARTDADEAVAVARAALDLPLMDQRRLTLHLGNLGMALLDRFRFTESATPQDLDEAITVLDRAVQATAADHPYLAGHLYNLGIAQSVRASRTHSPSAMNEAVAALTAAAEVGAASPSIRIDAARTAAMITDSGAAELLETAVRLLPTTVPRQLGRRDKQRALGRFAGLASTAAATALQGPAADPAKALQLLELGRGVLLSQALDTRSELTELGERHPALAARFAELRNVLDQIELPVATPTDDRIRLAAEFEAVTTEIRALDGFSDFMLPPDLDELLQQALDGDVVVVNTSSDRSDALLLRPDGIRSLPLPDLSLDDLLDRVESFHDALDMTRQGFAGLAAERMLTDVLEWLWDTVAGPILDALSDSRVLPRVWWSPGGLLGHLPLHAAGYHRAPGGHTVLDRVISSYTPTVRALDHARRHQVASSAADRALIVAMPTTPGHGPLHHVNEEALLVARRVQHATVLVEGRSTRDEVLSRLADSTIAHFACHGSSTPNDPSQSRLLLSDHETHPLTVESLAPIRLEHARLAYLSACRSAFNPASDLLDEAIHLTAAFQLAGYPHVIGTLWKIDDALAARVADTFYAALDTGNGIDTTRAARALHHIVRTLRDEHPAHPSLWGAYLHSGA